MKCSDAFAACLCFILPPPSAAVEPPNIVLVMADDQGWGDMAYNGHPHLKTPNFDALAKEGCALTSFMPRRRCARRLGAA
jgi:hypothetical protein